MKKSSYQGIGEKTTHKVVRLNDKDIMKNKEDLVAAATALIKLGEKVMETETESSNRNPLVNEKKFHDFKISALSFFSRVFGNGSAYYQNFHTEVTQATASRTRRGISMLTAATRDLQGNWFDTTKGAITRDILSDILRLAQNQLDEGNTNAAVITTGTILTTLLRSMCLAKGININNEIQGKAVPKKPLQLTGEAYKKKLYERQDNKEIISWIELTQAVTEGKNSAVSPGEAKKLIQGVHNLIGKLNF